MSKKLLLVIVAASSFGAFAETADQNRNVQFDTSTLCVYGDVLYSIGAQIQTGKTTLTCIMPGKSQINSSGSYNSDMFKTAHWG